MAAVVECKRLVWILIGKHCSRFTPRHPTTSLLITYQSPTSLVIMACTLQSERVDNVSDAIAIIGMGCRLPGDVKCPSDLWNMLLRQQVANSARVPSSRFNIAAFLHENPERPGSFNVPGGYFLDDDLEYFDPTMFNLSPIEAAWMDPQQRKLLEVVYEAIENSGTPMHKVASQVTGCFAASFVSDWQQMIMKEPDFRHSYTATGVDPGILGNRISHVFGLRGPSVLMNTACSSTMYALDAACNAVRRGECEGAIVGGANLVVTVDQQINTAKLGVLSPTNACHTFDESADGYGRADGVGALYIKGLAAAMRDGDPIRGVIRSVCTNANGRHSDNGITYPSIQGQRDVILKAYELAGLSPDLTTYIETHGTGTKIGDSIELHAVSQAMRPMGTSDKPILVGSVKPNVGHSEASSSIATIMKVVMALENKVIPPTAGVRRLARNIDWENWKVKVVTEPTPFPTEPTVRRVGVSAFGYGGTNGHAIVENVENLVPDYRGHKLPSHSAMDSKNLDAQRPFLLPFSAHNKISLRKNIKTYAAFRPIPNLLDLSYTLSSRRTALGYRTFAVCYKHEFDNGMLLALERNVWHAKENESVAFAFTGQGAQWTQMGLCLMRCYPSFRHSIQDLDSILSGTETPPSWTLLGTLERTEADNLINEPTYSQPLCTAIQIALVDLLFSWGVKPAAVIGHSSGEIAAAYAAGIISSKQALLLAYYRGKAVAQKQSDGAMLAVANTLDEAKHRIQRFEGRVAVACINSPSNVTLSGERCAIEELKETFDKAGIFARALKTSGNAYHSHLMKPVTGIYESYISDLFVDAAPKKGTCPMFSTVSGCMVDESELNPEYWVKNLISPVQFADGFKHMVESTGNIGCVLEIGPHAALSGPIRQLIMAQGAQIEYIATLRRGEDDAVQLLKAVGTLWARNVKIDIDAVTQGESVDCTGQIAKQRGQLLVDLPPYQWAYSKKLWFEARQSREHRQAVFPRHDILGRRIAGSSAIEPVWRNILRHKDLPWLKDHSLGADAIFPATGYFAMAIEALTQIYATEPGIEIQGYTLRDVSISTALVIPAEDDGVEVIFRMSPLESVLDVTNGRGKVKWYSFSMSSVLTDTWKRHAEGKIAINVRKRGRKPRPIPAMPMRTTYKSWNERLRSFGFDFGPSFRNTMFLNVDGITHCATADIAIKKESGTITDESRYCIHPVSLDSCLQITSAAIVAGRLAEVTAGTVLTFFDEVSIWPPRDAQLETTGAMSHVSVSAKGSRSFLVDAQMIAHDGELIADFSQIRCLYYEAAIPQSSIQPEPTYMQQKWLPDIVTSQVGIASLDTGRIDLEAIMRHTLHKYGSLNVVSFDTEVADLIQHLHPSAILDRVASPDVSSWVPSSKDPANLVVIPSSFVCGDIEHVFAQLHIEDGSECIIIFQGKYPQIKKYLDELSDSGELLLKSITDWDLDESGHCIKQMHAFTATSKEIQARALSETAVFVYRNQQPRCLNELMQAFLRHGRKVRISNFKDLTVAEDEQLIMLTDAAGPMLADMEKEELSTLQRLLENPPPLLWLTFGDLTAARLPEHSMMSGWSRVVRNEIALLKLVLVDLAESSSPNLEQVVQIARRQLVYSSTLETEYAIRAGVVHICRIAPFQHENEGGRLITLAATNDKSGLTGFARGGRVMFRIEPDKAQELGPDQVEIDVCTIGLWPEDSFAANGSLASELLNHEVAGTVLRVGSRVESVTVGDRVAGFCFGTLSPIQVTPARLVKVVPEGMDSATTSSVYCAFTTAHYALHELGRLSAGDNVVILDGSGSCGHAALQLCRLAGARVSVITHSNENAEALRKQFPYANVLMARDRDIVCQLADVSDGKGVDIILAPSFGDISLLMECSRAAGTHGRLIRYGQTIASQLASDLNNTNGLNFDCFDIKSLAESRKLKALERNMHKVWQLLENGEIYCSWNISEVTVGEIDALFHSFPTDIAAARPVIRYSKATEIHAIPAKKRMRFRNDASYLLVGCLGGLGRSLTNWMVNQGATSLIFLSRSGATNREAAELVRSVRARGVDVTVIQADVSSKKALTDALTKVDPARPIRGVVNAAGSFKDSMFRNMTIDAWHAALQAKVKGSLNLHEAFTTKGELDFFLMTGSASATLGSAGQSNYASGNNFLDGLARHRSVLGLPGVSLILPMVLGIGYVADRPELEATIIRKGTYGIEEQEMLQSFEDAMLLQTSGTINTQGNDHLIVGLQPKRLAAAMESNTTDTEATNWLRDSRLLRLASMIEAHGSSKGGNIKSNRGIQLSIKNTDTRADAQKLAEESVIERMSRLLMLELDEVKDGAGSRSVASYGLDSMIGAEFRNWIFREFGVDVVFQKLLAGSLTISGLATLLCNTIREETS
ncbi:hypothetical protein EJ05DRAFT_461353 [Pseudovirgaria hyperparasitica]|uniref:Polyketide synthase n=1 Tax=Pseudovirgaria hyperparasitica TaxID=470096 RepID=A0A6A6WI03_9PEZI|nr:uncharacterized protein EJ05DRAFT_461353 [Pseudovirgaria hyperparasitica]KAF2760781.1 hypothetical protein EJ05DRAFT_461353 [Pseudovirgaria hyperparasitica]